MLSNVRCFSIGQGSRIDLVVARRKRDYLSRHTQSYIQILRESIRQG